MLTALKVVVFLIGGLFLLIGVAGMFTPENFASGLGLNLASAEGAGTVRAMIGAHYVAMGGVCVYAMIRQQSILLFPIAIIEATMVIARGLSAVSGEFSASTAVPTGIEIVATLILLAAAAKFSPENQSSSV